MNIGPTLKIDNFLEVKKRMEFWESLDKEVYIWKGPTEM
jgi:hypothetical protein